MTAQAWKWNCSGGFCVSSQVTELGVGGYIGNLTDESASDSARQDAAIAAVRRAIELGVRYFDTAGKPTKQKLDRLVKLEPLQTIEFLIERRDASGGSGANFIIEWHAADRSVHAPLIEAVMVGRSGTNAISFVRKSEPLPEWVAD